MVMKMANKTKKKLDEDQTLFREEMINVVKSKYRKTPGFTQNTTLGLVARMVIYKVHLLYINKFIDYKKITKEYNDELTSLFLVDEDLYHETVDFVHNFILVIAHEKAVKYELYETAENIKRFDEEFFRNYY